MGRTAGHDGLEIAWERIGSGPIHHVFVHATGFCKETWQPVVEEIGGGTSLLIDQRGHGDSERPVHIEWWDLGRDVHALLKDADLAQDVVGVGHSSGGAAIVMAELLAPGTFDRLVLLEPIILPPPRERLEEHPLAEITLKRRRSFDSPEAAFESYHGRGPFAVWDVRALRAFADHGFRDQDGEWALKCAPEIEAEYYRTAYLHDTWDRLGEVECRVELLFGSASTADSAAHAEPMATRFRDAHLTVVEGAGHLLAMELPGEVARIISER